MTDEAAAGTPRLAAALAAFQAEMPTVPKSHTAKVPTKSGGQYSYTYADLADVTEAATPLLSSHGLSFSCAPEVGERGLALRGVLLHDSGEERSGVLPLSGSTPQELGSSLTYMRRYLLGCLTGIVTDDDDDGNLAQKAASKPAAQRKSAPRQAAPAETPADGMAKLTPSQRGMLFKLFERKGIAENEQLPGIAYIVGREVEHRDGPFTRAEFDRVIAALESRPDAEAQS